MAKSQMSDEQLALLLKNLREWLSASDAKAAKDVAMRRGGRAKKKRRQYASGGAPGAGPPSTPVDPGASAAATSGTAAAAPSAASYGRQTAAAHNPFSFSAYAQPQQAQAQTQMPQPAAVQQQPDYRNQIMGYFNQLFGQGGSMFGNLFSGANGSPLQGLRAFYGMDNVGPGMRGNRAGPTRYTDDYRLRASGGQVNDAASNAMRIARGLR